MNTINTGDTAWLLFQKLDRAETERYLEDRRRKGFNVVLAVALHGLDDKNAYSVNEVCLTYDSPLVFAAGYFAK